MNEGISLVLTVTEITPYLQTLGQWREMLRHMNIPHEIIVVSSNCNVSELEKSLQPGHDVIWESIEAPAGVGACLRAALPRVHYPFLLHLTLDYPYSPKDLKHMWERIHQFDFLLHKPPDIVSGCRTGLPTPYPWKIFSKSWQMFWRLFSGLPMQPLYPWHGIAAILLRQLYYWIFSIPLLDPFSGCKLYRTEFLKRIPIQSNGIFVHVELAAKATFLTSIIDEVYLSQQKKPISNPRLSALLKDCCLCFSKPQFTYVANNDQSRNISLKTL
jgi:hypothetical protein